MNRRTSWSRLCALLVCSAAAGVLAGCVTATPYQPAIDGHGYSEQKLESNRYKVLFAGNSSTPRRTVENYLLYRAAEVTLQNGYDYFVLVDQSTDADTEYRESFSGGYGWGPYYWYPRYGMSATATSSAITEYEAQANILVFKGSKPADNPRAFDARDLKSNLESYIQRPQPK